MIRNHLATAALIIALLPSCAPRLTKSAKAQLTSLSIPAATQHAKAYQDPQSMTADSAGAIGLVSGLTFGLAGGVAAVAGAAIKQSTFEGKYKNEVEAIKAQTPKDIGQMFTTELSNRLANDPFYGPRLKAGGAGGRINIEVRVLTLVKNSDRTHSPAVSVTGSITGPDGKKLLPLMAFANGSKMAGVKASLATYAKDPVLLRKHYEQVTNAAAAEMARFLQKQSLQAQ
jgi:hypothetical protein